ncbi:somatostatin receptor type 3-like [Patiria miniata]|uniref:G-protein coupled receptors family 1 profile domain-containing protein n=1 Tax=Patiria miniata TaxID=46514 RepID=A0A914A0G6_PATMI|nr:somatostatin receptor type 3-like [Patiria miniata]
MEDYGGQDDVNLNNVSAGESSVVRLSQSAAVTVVYIVIVCLALLSNALVIIVMLARRQDFSSFTNRLILHQSVIDSIAALLLLLLRVVKNSSIPLSQEDNALDQLICRVLETDVLLWWSYVASTYCLVIISLERFVATCYPVKHRCSWSASRLKYAVATPWALSAIYCWPAAVILRELHQGQCLYVKSVSFYVMYGLAGIIVEFLVPVSIMTYAYARILIILTRKLANPVNGRHLSKAKKNVLITSVFTGVMFLVCWTPLMLYNLFGVFVHLGVVVASEPGFDVIGLITCMAACSTFVNPVVYCFMYERFRSQLKDLVVKRCRRNQVGDGDPISINTATLEVTHD